MIHRIYLTLFVVFILVCVYGIDLLDSSGTTSQELNVDRNGEESYKPIADVTGITGLDTNIDEGGSQSGYISMDSVENLVGTAATNLPMGTGMPGEENMASLSSLEVKSSIDGSPMNLNDKVSTIGNVDEKNVFDATSDTTVQAADITVEGNFLIAETTTENATVEETDVTSGTIQAEQDQVRSVAEATLASLEKEAEEAVPVPLVPVVADETVALSKEVIVDDAEVPVESAVETSTEVNPDAFTAAAATEAAEAPVPAGDTSSVELLLNQLDELSVERDVLLGEVASLRALLSTTEEVVQSLTADREAQSSTVALLQAQLQDSAAAEAEREQWKADFESACNRTLAAAADKLFLAERNASNLEIGARLSRNERTAARLSLEHCEIELEAQRKEEDDQLVDLRRELARCKKSSREMQCVSSSCPPCASVSASTAAAASGVPAGVGVGPAGSMSSTASASGTPGGRRAGGAPMQVSVVQVGGLRCVVVVVVVVVVVCFPLVLSLLLILLIFSFSA
jgi:hypothetical protein